MPAASSTAPTLPNDLYESDEKPEKNILIECNTPRASYALLYDCCLGMVVMLRRTNNASVLLSDFYVTHVMRSVSQGRVALPYRSTEVPSFLSKTPRSLLLQLPLGALLTLQHN